MCIRDRISPKLKALLKDVTFQADGNIVATYVKDGKDVVSPINLANYYFKDGKLYVTLNIDMIIQAATKADNNEELMKLITDLMQTPLMSALSEGFPLNCVIDDKGVANIYIDVYKRQVCSIQWFHTEKAVRCT